jgi:hypothetical protein
MVLPKNLQGEKNMKNKTSKGNTDRKNSKEIIRKKDSDSTELNNSKTPDSYDAHIIPAETAARKENEGENFKHLPTHPIGPDNVETTDGFTVDKEGLMDNFPIEPEMYYETRGDVPHDTTENEDADLK